MSKNTLGKKNIDRAAGGRDHQWWHPELIAEEKQVNSLS